MGQDEAATFAKQLEIRLGKENFNIYELGEEEYSGYQYPAVDVADLTDGNAAGAWISGGYANDYGNSVMKGVDELIYRITDLHSDCPDTRIVLAGYSQGAQVMGQYITALSDDYPEYSDQIEFVALFGDPKLNLPEGRGFYPPACKNEQLSSWRRTVPDCDTDNGSLGARDPYLSDSMKDKVGLWCNDEDFVCGSSKNPFATEGHGKYYDPDGAIDEAVLEIAERIKERTHNDSINIAPDPTKVPEGKPDVMIVIDNTTQFPDVFDQFILPTVNSVAKNVTDKGGRVGLQTFNGCVRKGYTYNVPLSNNPGPLIDKARTMWKFSSPQCDLSQDLINTIKNVKASANWSDDAEKIILTVPKIPFENPAVAISAILSTTPAFQLYSIAPETIRGSYDNLEVDSIKNQSIDLTGFTEVTNNQATESQLAASLGGADIVARPNSDIVFDASASKIYKDTVSSYDWDFDSDGIIDSSTAEPRAHHIYTSPFSGSMNVTVRTQSGLVDTASQQITIKHGQLFPKPAKAPVNLRVETTSNSTVRFSWQPNNVSANAWVITLNDTILGQVVREQHYINISDMRLDESNILSVRAMEEDGTLGEQAFIDLKDMKPGSVPKGRFPKDIRLDANTHPAGQVLGVHTASTIRTIPDTPNPQSSGPDQSIQRPNSILDGLLFASTMCAGTLLCWRIYLLIKK